MTQSRIIPHDHGEPRVTRRTVDTYRALCDERKAHGATAHTRILEHTCAVDLGLLAWGDPAEADERWIELHQITFKRKPSKASPLYRDIVK